MKNAQNEILKFKIQNKAVRNLIITIIIKQLESPFYKLKLI